MKQKIKIPIRSKIINRKNIEEIATYLYKLKTIEKDYFNISFIFKNEMEISSEDLSCLKNRKIEEYEISKIYITYRDYNYTGEVDVIIHNYDLYECSYIEICFNDEKKLGSVEHDLTELLGFCKKQSMINLVFKKNFSFATTVGSFMSVFSTSFLIPFLKKYTDEYATYEIFVFLIFAILYFLFFRNLFRTYPNIEIDINDKTNKSKRRRNLILNILSLIVIPVFLDIIVDFAKAMFSHWF